MPFGVVVQPARDNRNFIFLRSTEPRWPSPSATDDAWERVSDIDVFGRVSYILFRVELAGAFFMLSVSLLQRVGEVRAGEMSPFNNPASPFSIALSTFCMMILF